MGFSVSFSASALQCYKCGGLSNRPRDITDCLVDPNSGGGDGIGLETCGEGEACVTFKRLYKKASGKQAGRITFSKSYVYFQRVQKLNHGHFVYYSYKTRTKEKSAVAGPAVCESGRLISE